MSMILTAKAMGIKTGNPLRKLVLLKLADNANDQGEAWPSVPYIAEQCEMSVRSVQNHIDALEKSGLLWVEERKVSKKLNQSNIYHLTLDKADKGGESPAPEGGANAAPGGESPAPEGGANAAPRTSHLSEPVNEPVLAKQSVKRATQLPKEFKANDKHRALAGDLGVSLDIEFPKFCDHHTAKGSTFKCWDAAFNNWLRNAMTFGGRKSSSPRASRDISPSSDDIPEGFR